MKVLQKELNKAMMKCFKQNQIAMGLAREFNAVIEILIFAKYEGTKIKRDNYEYDLFAVRCDIETGEDSFEATTAFIEFIYTISSIITEEQDQLLKNAKNRLLCERAKMRNTPVPSDIKLWVEELYDIDIADIINDKLNFIIEDKIA